MTLRLDEELERRLRAESERTGESQAEIIKVALRQHLRVVPSALDRLIEQGLATPPSRPRRIEPPRWSSPVPILDLMDREDRL